MEAVVVVLLVVVVVAEMAAVEDILTMTLLEITIINKVSQTDKAGVIIL
jgi:hypothetical protein